MLFDRVVGGMGLKSIMGILEINFKCILELLEHKKQSYYFMRKHGGFLGRVFQKRCTKKLIQKQQKFTFFE
jgi:hypothetical protein